ncbi:gliding motility lipoprotein GldD [Maribacter polysaccharolyticus]|uniref:gliding motility lipoprotein GldD n=1 Tax=Maribacter polysaccharolyticus TaxID=3020831 RepID=UPI00237FC409|nr:gliding motility lipoprotein GldD [Maribacter polysaccharolyticus]MDE3743044.1 gliding motility lipoprotein GldD [Maribacter polysaccharolyticus]
MSSKRIPFVFFSMIVFISCQDGVIPKPNAKLRLEYPQTEYRTMETDHFKFLKNAESVFKQQDAHAMTLDYPSMKGSLFITYKEVDDNIDKLLSDAQKLSIEHSAKADGILPHPFINERDKVYGTFFEVVGDAASQAQFYVTDSTEHFLAGSLYFYTKPNYDSIYPAAVYLQDDIKKFMESVRWK